MNRMYVVVGIVSLVILSIGVGAALYTGVGPAPGDTSGEPIDDFPTATESNDDDAGSSSSADMPPFSFVVDDVEECGTTCRDVTATLHNHQNETATGVTVFIRIFAGENNTDTDDVVWEGTVEVGTLESDAAHTSTERVELSLRDGRKVDQEDGWITIVTAVETDERTVTFQESEQVT